MTGLFDTLRRLERDHRSMAEAVQWNAGPVGIALDDPELQYHLQVAAVCYVKRLELTK